MLKRIGAAIAAVLICLAIAPVRAEIIEQVLVKVNGDIITKSEFELRQVAELRNRPELANVTPNSPELQKAIAQVTPDLILSAVDELLLIQRGRELGYSLGDEQFKQIVENIKKQNNLEDEERFQAALKQENMTMTDLRRNLERQMLVSRVQQVDIMDKISVTEEEEKTYYDAHRQQFTTPSDITLREILVEVPQDARGVNVAQDDAVRDKAEEIRKRLLAGEPFPKLAGEVSTSSSKTNGGLIGPISYEEIAPSLQQLLDKMQIGDITELLRTQRGYQILKLEARTPTKIRAFDEAREDIARKVAEEKSRGEMVKYVDRLREQATIVFRNDELMKAYEQALATRRRASSAAPATAGGQ
jgi:peptidyl-prolyl cis-trans isomerase SurA